MCFFDKSKGDDDAQLWRQCRIHIYIHTYIFHIAPKNREKESDALAICHIFKWFIDVWIDMPADTVDFTSLTNFKKSTMRADITAHLKCF